VEQSQTVVGAVTGARGVATTVELTRAEQAIVRRVSEARATVPDLELGAVADMSAWPAGPVPSAALVRASAAALAAVPRANASYRDGRFELYSRVNVGVVLPTADAFVAATVFDADRKPVSEVEEELDRLARRALASELTPPELAGATFTVWNLGEGGIVRATAAIIPPQAGALAAGSIRPVPVLRDGAVAAGQALELTLVCDGRILYGPAAAELLGRITTLLEDPAAL
jgi:pyruvate dehydrogenase E2 component (dihydrolipoamide acetyltransferase)